SILSQAKLLSGIRIGSSYINISGKQRMRSQRISFLSAISATSDCADRVDDFFNEELEDFVIYGEVVPSFCAKEECRKISFEATEGLNQLVDELSSTHTTCGVFEKANSFLYKMDELVSALEGETKDQVDYVEAVITAVQIGSALLVSVMTIVYACLTNKRNKMSSEAMDKMVQYLFHEIRNPLNHVVHGIDHVLSTEQNLPDLTRTELNKCATGGLFITSILNDVLTLAFLESKNHLFNTSPSSIQKLLLDTAHVASLTSSPKRTIVKTECRGELVVYDLDRVKLSQVLMNLATNAVKYAGYQKRVVVGATLLSRGILKDRVCFYVADNGTGITPETKKLLFDRFRTFSRNSGSGIGLHISQVIVQKMGGDITVTSPLTDGGEGTKFEFTLSLTRSISIPAWEGESNTLKRDVNVLIADDERINCVILQRKFLNEHFVALGWTSDYVITLEEVLTRATSAIYDLILLDEHFGTSQRGSTFIETLKKHGVESKIFIASANCSAADNEMYMARGAAGTIPKPTPSAEVLLRIMNGVL
ncbi:unnamed protein product, partial [Ectocarpus sp. 4 AP-2014]